MDHRSGKAWTAAFLSGAAVFACDQWLKWRFFDRVHYEGEAFSFLNGLIRSTLFHNHGISFNIPLPLWVIILITGAALGWALALLIERAKLGNLIACLLIGLFVGGTLGNAYDRLTLGFVRDWLLLFGRSAINLADIAIGGALLAYLLTQTYSSES
ncbi:MAG TPA: signal peptidase II [Verrucomicrobiae bacterium]|nr:signal peptidase II [Verrucomicrobiae bacterium]